MTLSQKFDDIPCLKTQLHEDCAKFELMFSLADKVVPVRSGTVQTKSKNGCSWVLSIVVVTIVCAALLSSDCNNSYAPSSDQTDEPFSQSSPVVEQTPTETEFSSESAFHDSVYIDIISIFPEIGIYVEGRGDYSYFVSRCKTAAGDEVWVYMTANEYKEAFDADAPTSHLWNYADEVTLSPSKRIHGTVTEADNIMFGLSDDTGAIVIDFSSVQ